MFRPAREPRRSAIHDVGCAISGGSSICASDEFPMRAAVRRFRDADGRAVNPGDTRQARHIRTPVGAKHPPASHQWVPDQRRVRRAIIKPVAYSSSDATTPAVLQPDTASDIKIEERQTGQVHAEKMERGQPVREFFPKVNKATNIDLADTTLFFQLALNSKNVI